MIKIRLRKNLLYLLVYYIAAFINNNFIGILIRSWLNTIYLKIFSILLKTLLEV